MSNPGPAISNSVHPQGLTSQQANRLLFVLKGLPVSAAGDTALPVSNSSNYSVQQIVVANANVAGATTDVSGVNFGLYTQTSQNGTGIKTTAALTSNTSQTVVNVITPTTTALQSSQTLYANIAGTPVAGATVDLYVFGYDLSPTLLSVGSSQ
jgi:hypothetical protein